MAKSETQSQGTFRQFFRAFKRRVSPARPLATESPISANVSTAAPSNKIPIYYNHSNNAQRPEPMKPGPKNIHQQNKPGVKFQDEKFTNFIDETKKKMKANSSFVADENGPTKRATTRRDTFNDRVSHFINRAKLKIRTTTIVDHADGTR
ncbi:hypothetical protein H5410_034735 [Solanum commersonii]|uniref:Uncharacterized protein n=1 Tax=Solanum commersonii TaxID=4109 RepID=A0A9J5YU66_SOLCO|nr:hypothetical protein H5410_034735 [Solanum commersonii]